jgi:hypothetical protein
MCELSKRVANKHSNSIARQNLTNIEPTVLSFSVCSAFGENLPPISTSFKIGSCSIRGTKFHHALSQQRNDFIAESEFLAHTELTRK